MSGKASGHAEGPLSHCHADPAGACATDVPARLSRVPSRDATAEQADSDEHAGAQEQAHAHVREHEPGQDRAREHVHDAPGSRPLPAHDEPGHDHAHGAAGQDHGHGHGHDHDHDHGLSARPHGGRRDAAGEQRRLMLALGVTATILFAEIAGGIYSGSLALLSDAGHMLTDASAIFIALLASRVSLRRADPRRTFGYYRYEILAALLNGALLMALAGYIGFEAWHRVLSPPAVKTGPMIVVALAGLVANGVGVFLLRGRGHSLNLRAAYLHLLSDTLSSVAVVAGGVTMWLVRGAYLVDPILSVLIAVLILVSGFRLLREAVDVLLEAVPPGLDCAEIASAMIAVPGVARVHDLHVWCITSGMYSLSVHLVLEPDAPAAHNDLLGQLRELLCARFQIDHTTIQVENEGYNHLGRAHR
jgi:cobalt-zinc-cadmium efflux system protein